MSCGPLIKTPRLTLRPLIAADGHQVVRLLDDIAVSRWLTVVPHPYTLADFNGFLAHLADTSSLGGLAIELRGQVVGVVGLDPTLGYWLGRAHQGQGIMSEAAGALVDWTFARHDIHCIRSGYFEGNAASQSVLYKLGFQETGETERVNCISQDLDVKLIRVDLPREIRTSAR